MPRMLAGVLLLAALTASNSAFAQRSVWVAVMLVYQAPYDAVDWDSNLRRRFANQHTSVTMKYRSSPIFAMP